MAGLTDRLLSAVKKNAYASIMSDSTLIKQKNSDFADTGIPMLNTALSGSMHRGLPGGVLQIAGASKMGKSLLGLYCLKGYMSLHEDAYMVFLDSEFGTNATYFNNVGISMDRVIHVPLKNIEEMKFAVVKMLNELQLGDHVCFFLDSLGNIPSIKELEDAENEKSVADMTRAKSIKSFARMITMNVNIVNVPFIIINHSYEAMNGLVPTQIASGGSGATYISDTTFFLSKAQDKGADKELLGYDFKLRVNKSRYVKENSVFCLNSSFEEGPDKYSDMLDFALESGYIIAPKQGWYKKAEKYQDEKMYRKKETIRNDEFWKCFMEDSEFCEAYDKKYAL